MSEDSQESTAKCAEKCPMKEEIHSLIYWRKPIKTAIVLTALLVAEFSFLCMSTISLIAYTGFLLLIVVNAFRFYYHYVAKTESHIIKDFLERDVTLPEDRVADIARRLTDLLNKKILIARDIFLLTDIGASIKFGIVLYVMTYIGAWFNFLTLCIICTLMVFFVPKFYESYKSEIDRGVDWVRVKMNKAASQIGKQMDKLPLIGSKKPKAQ